MVCHEIGHLITWLLRGPRPVYDESAGINEAYADMLGKLLSLSLSQSLSLLLLPSLLLSQSLPQSLLQPLSVIHGVLSYRIITFCYAAGETCDMYYNRKNNYLIGDDILVQDGYFIRDLCHPSNVGK